MMAATNVPSNVGNNEESWGIRFWQSQTLATVDAETKAIDAPYRYLNRVFVLSAVQKFAFRTLFLAMSVLKTFLILFILLMRQWSVFSHYISHHKTHFRLVAAPVGYTKPFWVFALKQNYPWCRIYASCERIHVLLCPFRVNESGNLLLFWFNYLCSPSFVKFLGDQFLLRIENIGILNIWCKKHPRQWATEKRV